LGKIYFLIGIHNHQPVGNFEHVFGEAFDQCYRPLLDTFADFPNLKFAIHHTGPLIEWIEQNRPEYLDKLKGMVSKGRTEILGGGFYEPILSSLPERDSIGQLQMMGEWTKKSFGKKPNGAWLAERIWDPALPRVLSEGGVHYTLLDDTHFRYAGLKEENMHGHYITERHGATTAVFPIDKELRYSIPFKQPEETLEYFKRKADQLGTTALTYGDDGEKFGLWPGTHDWVYNQKWLARFLEMLEKNRDVVETLTFSEYLKKFPSQGRIYLPMASYEEMMHWSLPTQSGREYSQMITELENSGKKEEYSPFLRGGLWDNFLVKYEESNRLHKRMIYSSERVNRAIGKIKSLKAKTEMLRELYKGQCNCPYWHGLFGGLYLSNLRHSVYTSLISAGVIADKALHKKSGWVDVTQEDYLKDGNKKVVVETEKLFALIDPSAGGTLAELDFKPARFNLSNTLTRREEEYHGKIINQTEGDNREDGVANPHEMTAMKEDGLADKLIFDECTRSSFVDSFLTATPTADELRLSKTKSILKYSLKSASVEGESGVAVLECDAGHGISIKKIFQVDGKMPNIFCNYEITNNGSNDFKTLFVVEWNFTLLAGDADDRYTTIGKTKEKMNSIGESNNINNWSMTDEYFRLRLGFKSSGKVGLFRYPIETVSQSEAGFESNYQGTCFSAVEEIDIKQGKTLKRKFSLTLDSCP